MRCELDILLQEIYRREGGRFAYLRGVDLENGGDVSLSVDTDEIDIASFPTLVPLQLSLELRGRRFGNAVSYQITALTARRGAATRAEHSAKGGE